MKLGIYPLLARLYAEKFSLQCRAFVLNLAKKLGRPVEYACLQP